MKSRILGASTLVLALALSAIAHADLSKKVIAEFKGQLIVSAEAVGAAGDDKATIAAFKKARLKVVESKEKDDVAAWKFSYTAFLKKAGATEATFEFYTDDKDHRYAANHSITGIDPQSSVISGDIEITEDDGLARGKSYILKLSGKIKGKDTVLAETPILMK